MKAPISLLLAAGLLTAGSVLPAQARQSCQKAIHKAQENLRKEVLRHGPYSLQARYRRHQLEVVRQRCGQPLNIRDSDRDGDQNRRNDGGTGAADSDSSTH